MNLLGKKPHTTFFIHVPKCGGLSIKNGLKAMVPKQKCFELKGNYEERAEEYKALSDAGKKQIQLVFGHQYYGLHEFTKNRTQLMTMLREPRQRMLSLYNYVFRAKGLGNKEFIRSQKPTFTELFNEEYQLKTVDNGIVRFLAGANWDQVPYGKCDQALYDRAMQNLDQFAAIGMVDEFDKSLLLFKKAMNSKVYPVYQRKNTTADLPDFEEQPILKFDDIPESDWESVYHFMQWDIKLYENAQAMFEKSLGKNQSYIEKHLPIFLSKLDAKGR